MEVCSDWSELHNRVEEVDYEACGYETYAEYEFDNIMSELFQSDIHARWEWDDTYKRKYAKPIIEPSRVVQVHQPDQDVKEGMQWLQDHERIATWEKAMIERDNNPDIF